MRITTSIHNDYAVIKFEGSLTNEHLKEMQSQTYGIFDKKKHIILDFIELTYISSSILSALLCYHNEAEAAGLKFFIFGLNDDMTKLFNITQINNVLKIFTSIDEAIQAISK